MGAALLGAASTLSHSSPPAKHSTEQAAYVVPRSDADDPAHQLEACVQPVAYRGGPLETCPWTPPERTVIPAVPGH